MDKLRILTRQGTFQYIPWSYDPNVNTEAKEKAQKKLAELGVTDAEVYEVAPEVFWYSTPEKSINCSLY